MKQFNIIALTILTTLSLASCELKNELTGNNSDKVVTGTLELGVSVRQPGSQTRATSEVDNFPVVITGTSTEVSDVLKEYASVSEMPASISLPIGKYAVSSHTPGELQKKMDSPYYGGSVSMTISKDITTSADVICKMKNSRIQLNYGDDFKASFQSWTITVDDGSSTVLSYTDENKEPSPIYWYFDEDAVSAITVNIRATTTEGNTVSENRVFKKSDAAEKYDDVTDFFNGGDALEIKMGTVTSSTGNVDGITINTTITFENHDEVVEIPVNGEETPEPEPGEDTGNGPTIQLPADFSYSQSGEGKPDNADAIIKTPAGLQSAVVKIVTSSEAFEQTLKDVDMGGKLLDGIELVQNTKIDELFANVELSDRSPVAGATEYKFPIGAFFTFLDMFSGTHKFYITVTDNEGKTAAKVLTITITE